MTDIYIYGSITDYSKTRSGNSPHSSLEWYITLHCKVNQLRLRLRLLPPPHLGLLCGSPICLLLAPTLCRFVKSPLARFVGAKI